MKKFKILPMALLLLLFTSLLPVSALAAEPDIGASAAIVADASSGEVYYAKNADQALAPASTTKMVTALLVVEAVEAGDIALEDSVTAYNDCQYNMDEQSSNANPAIEPGEVMTVEDLLYLSMLASANEACNILAEYVSGSISAFVDEMNDLVRELGCTTTSFTNANGLEDSGHYTTASDFAIVAREALRHSLFVQICGAESYTVPATNLASARELTNTNSLLDPESDYYYEYAYGIKTGYFSNAGYCLVSAAQKDDIDVICVLLGAESSGDQYEQTMALYDWVFSNYSRREILSSAKVLTTVAVKLGTSDSADVRAQDAISAILPNDYDTSNVYLQETLYHEQGGYDLEAPVNAGDVLGEVTAVELDADGNVTRTFGTTPLVASTTVEMSRMEYLRTQIRDLFRTPVVRRIITILIILVVIYLLLVVFYYVQRVRHLRSVREAKRERARRLAEQDARWLDIPGHETGRRRIREQNRRRDDDDGYYDDDDDSGRYEEDEDSYPPQTRGRRGDDEFFDSFFRD